ncbi:MAG TPA: helix-turn-helix domain-containing protein [Nitrospiraceae bacterium]|nr:helix-turn-helix domain-containing protein [Nitrospiraceae bacterium]
MPRNDLKDRVATSPETVSMPSAYWDVKELSHYLHIKRSTLYAWVAQRKIPCVKINGLIRFRRDEIECWVESFRPQQPTPSSVCRRNDGPGDLDAIIASAKREVYTASRGKPDQDRAGKEGHDGTV